MDGFIYQFAIGGLVFAVGMAFASAQGYVGTSGKALRNLIMMVLGFFALMFFQGYLQYANMAPTLPMAPNSATAPPKTYGTNLDYGVMIGYFLAILAVGTFFGRKQKTIKDFFFGGQRFSWWLIAFSLVATTIGSYSFVKYSRVAYTYGLSSSQSYMNDWFWMPLLVFGWLPILYFSRITSIPEYFERRFGPNVRLVVTLCQLLYLVGYVGVNLFTMGKALNILVGWPIPLAAMLVATISAIYVTIGGQTSVIMTDLLQGFMLLATGITLLVLGIDHVGGFDVFWSYLPRGHRGAFSPFNTVSDFPAVGIFWQDAMANTAMFYFLNQGILMRFMSAKSVGEGRKAVLVVPLILMPVAACVVASGGWIGKAMVGAGVLPTDVDPGAVFFAAADVLSRPGFFGLVMAALTAALMSTVDTLITAVSAIVVNDLYKPYIKPDASDGEQLRVARTTAVMVTLTGIALVPVFMMFKSIYSAHGAFTAAVTPPMVVTLMLSVFWRRFTQKGAMATLVGGLFAIALSIFFPALITPFAHGVPMVEIGDGIFEGAKQYKFMRAFYGLVVSAILGITVSLFTQPEDPKKMEGLVWGTIDKALQAFKGRPGAEVSDVKALAEVRRIQGEMPVTQSGELPLAYISQALAEKVTAQVGDRLYISDNRFWLGGLRSAHVQVSHIVAEGPVALIALDGETFDSIVSPNRTEKPLKIERFY